MRFYEEFYEKSEKRKAQNASRPLKRKVPTGKARCYLMVFDEDGGYFSGKSFCYNAVGNVYNSDPGDGPHSLASANPSTDFLSDNCRVVGFEYLPDEWQAAFVRYINTFLQRDAEDYKGKNGDRYRRLIAAYNRRQKAKAA
jgi:hypothetical protein